MKKICFVSFNSMAPWGGSEELWSQVALLLSEKGFEVSALLFDWGKQKNSNVHLLETSGINVLTISVHQNILKKIRRNFNFILGDSFSKKLSKLYKKANPDIVIHTNMAPRGADFLAWPMKNNIPYIIDVQLADDFLWHSYNEKMVTCYKNALHVCFLCNKNKNTTEKQLGIKLTNAKKHFNPIKTPNLSNELYKKSIVTVHFACVGRMGIEHKRQDLLLEILSSKKWRNRNWVLSFYGNGEHENSLRRLVHFYELHNKVFFKGYVHDVGEIWEENHLLLLPSTYESVPMAVTEAMKCSRIVVTTNVGIAADYIEDGVNGFRSNSSTVDDFENAMERAWNSQANWSLIANSAQQTINLHFPENAAEYFVKEILKL